MKKKLIYLGLTGCILFALCTRLQAQIDSLQAHRYVTRATMYGVGFTNVFDTYLSPQEYKGIDFRISRETIRMTKLFDGNVLCRTSFRQTSAIHTTAQTTTIPSPDSSTGTMASITSSASPRTSSYWQEDCLTSTEDLSTISAIRTIRLLPGHTSIWTLREWLSGI